MSAIRTIPVLSAVHPHGRGDNLCCMWGGYGRDGSPPRAWGQLDRDHPKQPAIRFTPTGVGTIPAAIPGPPLYAVHPHGRGDNRYRHLSHHARRGSPPRAWGQCQKSPFAQTARRFTPTGVGTIGLTWMTMLPLSVHPHGRGDNTGAVTRWRVDCGSPPRAWGQSPDPRAPLVRVRFTPTGVGTMYRCGDFWRCPSVHPHGRGDNHVRRRKPASQHGSPPRAWGQCERAGGVGDALRFTPTGVGTILERASVSTN